MGGGPPDFPQGFSCPVVLRILPLPSRFRLRGFHPLRPAFPIPFHYLSGSLMQSITPACSHAGLGSFPFARRYSENRCFFLFLRLLRCFSSAGSLPCAMDSRMDGWSSSSRVSPFGYPWINGYLLLPAAFRSLSRPSSAPGAKASALRPSLLDLPSFCLAWLEGAFSSHLLSQIPTGCFFIISNDICFLSMCSFQGAFL